VCAACISLLHARNPWEIILQWTFEAASIVEVVIENLLMMMIEFIIRNNKEVKI
jgi:hypothetical protein